MRKTIVCRAHEEKYGKKSCLKRGKHRGLGAWILEVVLEVRLVTDLDVLLIPFSLLVF